MRIMGLDVGTKTIGVAVSDPLGWTAQGVSTIKRTSLEKDLASLKTYINGSFRGHGAGIWGYYRTKNRIACLLSG